MVKLTHKGLAPVCFIEYKVLPGENEMSDDVFYKLMLHPSFAFRVKDGTFRVPSDFPRDKPYSVKKSQAEQEAIQESAERRAAQKSNQEENTEEVQSRMGTKQALRAIAATEDKEELKGFMNDDREKVVEAASKKLESLK